eukprot:CAMPEP_0202421920 /NCGR_PEP_ID=MMETSP1128-20130828/50590_1 /ASSEMBLY_ACC=CAM_ASM_000463 /TAXON_ID=3047 /ORGANISM="Dunaliella tertiolecta, Strain CCMP1320" /LENGTH=152 /DNA_ID=CAMNT_0049029963 /DNA_START=985 /DNA_END=1445 /DNA_ORIENTATION=+
MSAARSAAVWPSVREYDKQSTPGGGCDNVELTRGPAHKAALYVCAGDGGRSGDLTGVDRGWRRAPEASAPAAAVSTEQVAIAAAGVQMDVGVVYWAGGFMYATQSIRPAAAAAAVKKAAMQSSYKLKRLLQLLLLLWPRQAIARWHRKRDVH